MKKLLEDNLFVAFFALCAVMLAGSGLLTLANNTAPLAIAVTALCAMAVTVFLSLNRKRPVAYLVTVLVLVLVLWALQAAGVAFVPFSVQTAKHFFAGRALGRGETILVTSVLSLLLSAILFPLAKLRTVRYAAALGAAAMLVCCGIYDMSCNFTEVFAAAGILLAVPAELSLLFLYPKESRRQQTGILSFLLPLFLLFSTTVAVLPASDAPISWRFVTDFAVGVADKVETLVMDIRLLLHPDSPEFSISMQGYSDAGDIFGEGISGGGNSQLLLSCSSRPRGTVYLIGNVSDTYTGSGWSKSESASFSEQDFYLDYCETLLAIARAGYTKDEMYTFVSRATLTVQYDDIVTKTLFYPLKTPKILRSDPYNAAAPAIVLDKSARKGDTYQLTQFEINYRSVQFQKILRSDFSYADGVSDRLHVLDPEIPADVEETLTQRADAITQQYTTLPEQVTARTRALAQEITARYPTPYEKLRAIEEYLSGYAYTTSPGPVPEGQDPVDYFLFDSKIGYCTYFASAMAVLARCEGIPVRYVQGFAVDCSAADEVTDYPVPGSNAHAWVEAYLEGIGWIPFEPTVVRSEDRYNYRGNPVSHQKDDDFLRPSIDKVTLPETPQEETGMQGNPIVYLLIVLSVLFGLLLLAALYVAIRIRMAGRAYRGSTDTAKFLQCYQMTLALWEKRKYVRAAGETVACFAARLATLQENQKDFSDITAVFDRIRYGGGAAQPAERIRAEAYLEAQFAAYKEKRGKLAAFLTYAAFCMRQ